MNKNKINKINPRSVARKKQLIGSMTVVVGMFTSVFLTAYYLQAKNKPTVGVDDVQTKNTVVDFNISLQDVDQTNATIVSVDLYEGDTKVQSVESFDKLSFSNLKNNTTYHIEVTYTYDKNDGNGLITEVAVGDPFTTVALNEPTVSINNVTSTTTDVNFSVTLIDEDNTDAKIESIILNRNGVEFKSLSSFEDLSSLSFNGLYSGSEYQIEIKYSYDLNDGEGVHEKVITSETFFTDVKLAPSVSLNNVNVNENTITFSASISDEYNTEAKVESISLYKEDGTFVEKLASYDLSNTLTFTNLLNNNSYYIQLDYSYNLNDEAGLVYKTITSSTFTTRQLSTPSSSLSNVLVEGTTVTFSVDKNELDETNLTLTKVELLNNNAVANTLTDFSSLVFNNLKNNNEYSLKLYYTYDLNDGKGTQYATYTTVPFTTVALSAPTTTISLEGLTTESLEVKTTLEDLDNTNASITNISIYKSDDLVNAVESIDNPTTEELLSKQFKDLLSNVQYTVVVTYKYDLNDGNGYHVENKVLTQITDAKTEPTVEISSITVDGTKIKVTVASSDATDTSLAFSSLDLYCVTDDGDIKVVSIANFDANGVNIFNDNVYNDHSYYAVVNYSYDMNEGEGVVNTQVKSLTVTTETLTAADVTISNVSTTTTELSATINLISNTSLDSTIKAVELYRINDDLTKSLVETFDLTTIDSSLSTFDVSFDNLISNATYEIKVSYTYDLNDEEGIRSGFESTQAITVKKNEPIVTSLISAFNTDVTVTLSSSDDSDTNFVITSIDLYCKDDNAIVETITQENINANGDNVFNQNTLNNKTYYAIVNYTYNLNEGNENVVTSINSTTITTAAINTPTCALSTLSTTTTTLSGSVTLNKNSNETSVLSSIELYKDGVLVAEINPTEFSSLTTYDFTFENLLSNTSYIVKATYSYDLNDGKGTQTDEVVSLSATTVCKVAPTVNVSTITQSGTSISFSVSTLDDDNTNLTITSIDLYKVNADSSLEKVDSLTNDTQTLLAGDYSFSNLLNDNTYKVVVEYSYNLNEGNDDDTDSSSNSIQMSALVEPSVTLSTPSVTSLSVSFTVNTVNTDDVTPTLDKVELYCIKDGEEVYVETLSSANYATSLSFNNLLNDNTYIVKATYSYDLNDGNGTHTVEVKSTSFTTYSLTEPQLVFGATTLNDVSANISISFNENTSKEAYVTKVTLFDADGNEIDSIILGKNVSLAGLSFDNLNNNTTYYYEVEYVYDLNDGVGSRTVTKTSESFTTVAKTAPTVSFNAITTNTESNEFSVYLNDASSTSLTITSIDLYDTNGYVKSLNLSGVDYSSLSFDNLYSGKSYYMVIKYTYDLNDGTGVKTNEVTSNEFVTKTKTAPVIGATIIETTTDSISFTLTKQDNDSALTQIDSIYVINNATNEKTNVDISSLDNSLSSYDFAINNLLSGQNYTLVVSYTYSLNTSSTDSTSTELTVTDIVTLTNETALSFTKVSSTDTSISFTYDIGDNDTSSTTVTYAYLYNGEELVNTIANPVEGETITFTNLLSDTTYSIKLEYTYDKKDGNGTQSSSLSTSKATDAKLAPSVAFTNVTVDATSVSYNISSSDTYSTNLTISKVELFTKDGTKVNETTSLSSLSFNSLYSNTSYYMVITYSYNLNTGSADVTKTVTSELFTTTKKIVPTVTFNNISATGTTISYSLSLEDAGNTNATILSVDLYNADSNTLVKSIESPTLDTVLSFTSLNNDNSYYLVVNYQYDSNENNGLTTSTVTSTSVSTESLVAPTVTTTLSSSTINSLTFNSSLTANSSLDAKITKISIANASSVDTTIQEFTNPSLTTTFSSLLSNTKYVVTTTYEYDLNDGNGVQTVSFTTLATTEVEATPTVQVTNLTTSNTTLSFDLSVTNSDSATLSVTKVELYSSATNTLVDTITSPSTLTTNSFTDLLNDTSYYVVVYYSYNLNDGNGDVEASSKSTSITTVSLNDPEVTTEISASTTTSITAKTTISDLSNTNAKVTSIAIYKDNVLVEEITSPAEEVTFNSLLSNTAYTLKITYTYDLNDGNGTLTATKIVNTNTVSKTAPTVTIEEATITNNSLSFSISSLDTDTTNLTITDIKLYSLTNSSYVDSIDPTTVDLSSVLTFNDLLNSNSYKVVISYTYNLNDGKADLTGTSSSSVLTVSTLQTPSIAITNIATTTTGVTFETSVTDTSSVNPTIKSITLSDSTGTVATLTSFDSLSFDNLLSDHSYYLNITYSYDLNDGNGEHTVTKTTNQFTTVAKEEPSLVVTDLTNTETSVSFSVSTTDNDNTDVQVTKIEIISNNTVYKTLSSWGDLNSLIVDGLLNSNTYYVKVTYTYDLNDGQGTNEVSISSLEFTTRDLVAPTVSLTIDSTSQSSVSFLTSVLDSDNTNATITSIDLYLDGYTTPVQTITNLTTTSFNNLLSNRSYYIVVNYSYNLNDGNTNFTNSISSDVFKTVSKSAPTVAVENIVTNGTSVSFNIAVTDVDSTDVTVTSIKAIEINNDASKTVVLSSYSSLDNLTISDLLNNNKYYIEVTYEYNLNDGTTKTATIISETFATEVLVAPTVTITNVVEDSLTVTYVVNYSDEDNTGTINYAGLYNTLTQTYGDKITSFTIENDKIYITFDKLLNNTTYKVDFSYSYNLNDGNGDVSVHKESSTFTTAPLQEPTVYINDATLNDLVYSFNVTLDDSSSTFVEITDIDLISKTYSNNNQSLAASSIYTDGTTMSFNVLNGNEYYISITYTYDLHDGNGLQEKTITTATTVQTVTLSAPEVSASAVYTSGTTATLTVKVNDTSSTKAVVDSIKSYIQGNTTGETITFTASNEIVTTATLLNDNSYYFIASYSYDLNDGQGVRTATAKSNIVTTDALNEPTVTINNVTTSDTTASFQVSLSATEEVKASVYEVKIYTSTGKYYGEVTDLSDLTNLSFSGLLNDNSYYITVYYSYNLNDGNGTIYKTVSSNEFTTAAKTAPAVSITACAVDNLNVNLSVNISDTSSTGAKISAIKLYYEGSSLTDSPYKELTGFETSGGDYTFENIYNGHSYVVVVEYSYDLNDGYGTQYSSVTSADAYTLTTTTLTAPTLSFGSITYGTVAANTSTTLTTSLSVTDASSTLVNIDSIDVYSVTTKEKIGSISSLADLTSLTYSKDILNDNAYYLVANYTYNLNDGTGDISASITSSNSDKTEALVVPTASLGTVTKNGTTVTFSAELNETTGTNGKITNISVYHYDGQYDENDLYDSLTSWNDLTSLKFEDLLNDNTYIVVLTYTYDLNDGKGTRTGTSESESFITEKLDSPTVSVNSITATGTEITVDYSTTDDDSTIESITAILYDDQNNVVQTISNVSKSSVTFNKISSLTTYHVEIVATYNLNDGNDNLTTTATSETVTTKTVLSDLSYSLNSDGTMKIVKYKGTNTVVDLYDSYNGYTVTTIGDSAFANSSITSIDIPSTITTIESQAFYKCTSLTEVKYEGTIEDWVDIDIQDNKEANPMYYASAFKLAELNNETGLVEYNEVTEISLPSSVTSIGDYSFVGFNHVTTLSLPSELTSIGNYAFYGCSSLQEINIPESVTTLGEYAFYGATSSTSLTLNDKLTTVGQYAFAYNTALTSLEVPTNITSLGQYAFVGCTMLDSVTLNEGLETLNNGVFSSCTALQSITLPDSLTFLGYSVFANDTALNTVSFGKGLTSSKSNVFSGCTSLVNIEIPNIVSSAIATAVTNITSHIENLSFDGTMEEWLSLQFTSAKDNLIQYTTNFYVKDEVSDTYTTVVTSLDVPDTITNINNYAFYGYEKLESVNFNKVLTIGNSSFYGTGLTTVVLSNSIQSVSSYAFASCNSLTTVEYGTGLNSISTTAFNKSTKITTVYIPNMVSQVITTSISNIPTISNIYFEGTMEDWLKLNFTAAEQNPIQYATNFFVYTSSTDTTYTLVSEAVVPDTITSIGAYAFYGYKNLTSINLNNVTSLGLDAFYKCTGLDKVYFNGTVEEDWPNVELANLYANPMSYATHFYTYDSGTATYSEVTSIALADTITTLDDYTFYNFSALTDFTFNKSVTSSGKEVFKGCKSLDKVTYTGTIEEWALVDFEELYSTPMWKATHFYLEGQATEVTTINLSSVITEIKQYSFYNFSALEDITFTSAITASGKDAFTGCSSLKDVYYNGDIESWCKIKFASLNSNPMTAHSSSFHLVNDDKSVDNIITTLSIPSTVTTIGDYQFAGFNEVTALTLDDSVTSISSYAFSGCTSLVELDTNKVTTIGDNAFAGSSALTTLTITETVTSIGNNVFYGDDKITKLIFGDNVTSIGDYAFSGCTNITEIVFNSSLLTIGDYAFNECVNVKEVIIPSSVTTIGDYAFALCTSVDTVVIGDNVTSIGDYAFYNDASITSLTIGSSVKTIGDYAFSGAYQITDLTLPEGLLTIGDEAFSSIGITKLVVPSSVTSIGVGAFSSATNLEVVDLGANITTLTDCFTGCTGLTTFYVVPQTNSVISTALSTYGIKIIYLKGTIDDYVKLNYGWGYNYARYADTLYVLDSDGNYYEAKNLVLADTTTTIGSYVFDGYNELESIDLNNVTSIGTYAFRNATSLTSLDLSNVTTVNAYAFIGMSSLDTLTLSSKNTNISLDAFNGITTISNIYINDTTITEEMASLIENLSTNNTISNIYFNGTLTDWLNINFTSSALNVMQYANNFYLKDDNGNYVLLSEVNVPSTVTTINAYAFYGNKNITSVNLNNVTTIGEKAFYNCSSLTTLDISNVNTIEDSAFAGTSLTSLTVSGENTALNADAFYGVTTIETVYINKTISSSTTQLIDSLDATTIYYNGTTSDWLALSFASEEENPFSLGKTLYFQNEDGTYFLLTELDLENESVTVVNDYAFYNCSTLVTIKIPSTVTSIGDNAFTNCTALENVYLTSSLTTTGVKFLENNYSKTHSLVSVYFSGSLQDWLSISFEKVNNNPTTYSSKFYTYEDGKYVLLEKVDLSASSLTVNAYAFYNVTSLTTIILASDVTIGDYAFYNCPANVYFMGTEEEYATLITGKPVDSFASLTIYYYSSEANYDGSHFYFDEDNNPIIWKAE